MVGSRAWGPPRLRFFGEDLPVAMLREDYANVRHLLPLFSGLRGRLERRGLANKLWASWMTLG